VTNQDSERQIGDQIVIGLVVEKILAKPVFYFVFSGFCTEQFRDVFVVEYRHGFPPACSNAKRNKRRVCQPLVAVYKGIAGIGRIVSTP
jgi:hypothetical protein